MDTRIPGTPPAGNGPDHAFGIRHRIERILSGLTSLADAPGDTRAGFEILAQAIEALADHLAQPAVLSRDAYQRLIARLADHLDLPAVPAPIVATRIALVDGAGRERIVLDAQGPEGAAAVRLVSPDGAVSAALAVGRLGYFNDDYADAEGAYTAGLMLTDGDHAEVKAIASEGLASVEAMTVARGGRDDDYMGARIEASRIEGYAELASWAAGAGHFAFRARPRQEEIEAIGTAAG
ncbi:MAG: hypothetical protein FJZ01_09180 [Candidatus Sericytochromatia bacterium]|nr:hypothetical protein [Candidatus Tanganyikabacteria bacterium]